MKNSKRSAAAPTEEKDALSGQIQKIRRLSEDITADDHNPEAWLQVTKEIWALDTILADSSTRNLDTLYTDGFDEEQIWAQIQLRNALLVPVFGEKLDQIANDIGSSDKEDYMRSEESDGALDSGIDASLCSEEDEEVSEEEGFAEMDDFDEEHDVAEEFPQDEQDNDDGVKNNSSDEDEEGENFDDIDFSRDPTEFLESGSDAEAENLKYEDFFDGEPSATEGKKKFERKDESDVDSVVENLEQEDNQKTSNLFANSSDDENAHLSSFEKKQKKMDAKIKEIEEELVKEKDWQLKGETSSKQRPVNSLLEEVLEFDYAAKPAPVITEQVTNSLDELIKQRILNNSFDDLVRKYEEKKYTNERQIVDDSLSRKPESLAKVYEDEFRKEAASASGVVEGPKKTKEHLEIEQALQKLSYKLNSLSNFHYTPKPAKLELRVNPIEISTIEMEEAIPVAVSNEKLLAPQEMHKSAKNERELKTQEELDSKDKKILRTNAKKRRSKKKPKAPQQSGIEAK